MLALEICYSLQANAHYLCYFNLNSLISQSMDVIAYFYLLKWVSHIREVKSFLVTQEHGRKKKTSSTLGRTQFRKILQTKGRNKIKCSHLSYNSFLKSNFIINYLRFICTYLRYTTAFHKHSTLVLSIL